MLVSRKRYSAVFFVCALLTMTFSSSASPKKTLQQEEFISTENPVSFVYECHPELWDKGSLSTSVEFKLKPKKGRKRCEIAVQKGLERDKPFSLSFRFLVNDTYQYSNQWHSYFQIHSFPDKGESWRCPIMALETKNGKLRMYNRWDQKKISSTKRGSCAANGNSIRSRTLFEGVSYAANVWNQFRIEGVLSTSNNECLKTYLNEALLSETCGPNTFNDARVPFFKLGIYKPTSWDKYPEISLKVKDLELN
ncbi:heparin lyase I family protein [Vibrio penaeicida]|uniref:heparin lyase I family protein n=1 Tax=Vibrio penaeicida TaxID=104609 RepID=UPI000CEA3FA6|nr:heparin lyase I family protein [Vibrio penaeicida]